MGMTTNRDIPIAKSLVDYIFRWMGMEFIPGYREANAPARANGPLKSMDAAAATLTPTAAVQHIKEEREWTKIDPETDGKRLSAGVSRIANQVTRHVETSDVERTDVITARAKAISNGGMMHETPMIELVHKEHSTKIVTDSTVAVLNPLDQSNAALMGDAPACDGCGSITVRNGSCYKCMNCGNSMGCS